MTDTEPSAFFVSTGKVGDLDFSTAKKIANAAMIQTQTTTIFISGERTIAVIFTPTVKANSKTHPVINIENINDTSIVGCHVHFDTFRAI
ncbi:MAG: hypothetical protein LBQ42_04300 [Synergistaceae bacterium]|nr:hypothetical protein [Synergistaceae bacterium]